MNYSKPEVVKVEIAIRAIQNQLKQELDVPDAIPFQHRTSVSAYQADE